MSATGSPEPVLRIGTRGSPLALAQANTTRDQLAVAHGIEPQRIELIIIRTTGEALVHLVKLEHH